MKKLLTPLLLFVLSIGTYGNLILPKKENFDLTGGGGIYLRYLFDKHFSTELGAEYSRWNFSASNLGAAGTLSGKLHVLPVYTALRYHFPAIYQFTPMIGGGVSGLFISGTATGTLTPGGSAQIKFGNTIGGHATAGFERKIVDNLFFDFDTRYTFAKSPTTETVATGTFNFNDMNMYHLTLRSGLHLTF